MLEPHDRRGTLTDHTIKTLADSEGFISVSMINHGTVTADDGLISLFHKQTVNRALLESSSGGQLRIGIENDPTPTLDNIGGIVRAGAGSEVLLQNLKVTGSGPPFHSCDSTSRERECR